ncbi:MAG: DUF3108 domain-containing protein, partial [Candidatus Accumulibacter sp.]|nr:DUF3108 domain-containing protein [Accumulibacter sp.]
MGRMPVTLLAAFAASLCLHAVALFAPEIDPASGSAESAPLPLAAELRRILPEPLALPTPVPAPVPSAVVQDAVKAAAKTPAATKPSPPRKPARPAASPVMSMPAVADAAASIPAVEPRPASVNEDAAAPVVAETAETVEPAVSSGRLPPRGRIRFRVDRGDSGFEIGAAVQEWEFAAGRYRLVSSVETTGLAWLIRAVNIDMESVGRVSGDGLRPDVFGVMRSGRKARERALFDWETMKVRVSDERDHTLDPGAQDLLSFYYQLGFLNIPPGQTGAMPLATGKKYSIYPLENLGDESIEIPLGIV